MHDLSISLVGRESFATQTSLSSNRKDSKTRTFGLEILNGAHLRIKSGGRYGFMGRNGSGKSSASDRGTDSRTVQCADI